MFSNDSGYMLSNNLRAYCLSSYLVDREDEEESMRELFEDRIHVDSISKKKGIGGLKYEPNNATPV